MPKSKNLREPANGISRCKVCQKSGPPHEHSLFTWVDFRWRRNRGIDRPLIVAWAAAWFLGLHWLLGDLLTALRG